MRITYNKFTEFRSFQRVLELIEQEDPIAFCIEQVLVDGMLALDLVTRDSGEDWIELSITEKGKEYLNIEVKKFGRPN